MLPLLFCVYSMWIARSRRRRHIESLINSRLRLAAALAGNSSVGLTPLEVSLIPIIRYADSSTRSSAGTVAEARSDDASHTNCVICLLDYEAGNEIMILNCGHRFHKECGSRWLESSSKCPLCKNDLKLLLREVSGAIMQSEFSSPPTTNPNPPPQAPTLPGTPFPNAPV